MRFVKSRFFKVIFAVVLVLGIAVPVAAAFRFTDATRLMPTGVTGQPYFHKIETDAGCNAVRVRVENGSLPPGLRLVGSPDPETRSNYRIEGTPTTAGDYDFWLRATSEVPECSGDSTEEPFTIKVVAGLTITTASLPEARVGSPYSYQLTSAGGGNVSWSVVSGSPPAGMNVSSSGVVNGTPTAPGTSTFTVRASDGGGRTTQKAFTLAVVGGVAATQRPAISGENKTGFRLTATNGTWTGNPTTFVQRWQRCDASGANCGDIPNASGTTYTLASDDLGKRVRVVVTASGAEGSGTAASDPTAVITSGLPDGAIRLASGAVSVPVSSVAPPERLIVDRLVFTPNPVRSRSQSFTARFRVRDTRGYVVRDALVFARSTPLVTTTPAETPTGEDGWVTLTFTPKAGFPLGGANVQFFVRARKQGDDVLAGVSTRRLVQVRTARP